MIKLKYIILLLLLCVCFFFKLNNLNVQILDYKLFSKIVDIAKISNFEKNNILFQNEELISKLFMGTLTFFDCVLLSLYIYFFIFLDILNNLNCLLIYIQFFFGLFKNELYIDIFKTEFTMQFYYLYIHIIKFKFNYITTKVFQPFTQNVIKYDYDYFLTITYLLFNSRIFSGLLISDYIYLQELLQYFRLSNSISYYLQAFILYYLDIILCLKEYNIISMFYFYLFSFFFLKRYTPLMYYYSKMGPPTLKCVIYYLFDKKKFDEKIDKVFELHVEVISKIKNEELFYIREVKMQKIFLDSLIYIAPLMFSFKYMKVLIPEDQNENSEYEYEYYQLAQKNTKFVNLGYRYYKNEKGVVDLYQIDSKFLAPSEYTYDFIIKNYEYSLMSEMLEEHNIKISYKYFFDLNYNQLKDLKNYKEYLNLYYNYTNLYDNNEYLVDAKLQNYNLPDTYLMHGFAYKYNYWEALNSIRFTKDKLTNFLEVYLGDLTFYKSVEFFYNDFTKFDQFSKKFMLLDFLISHPRVNLNLENNKFLRLYYHNYYKGIDVFYWYDIYKLVLKYFASIGRPVNYQMFKYTKLEFNHGGKSIDPNILPLKKHFFNYIYTDNDHYMYGHWSYFYLKYFANLYKRNIWDMLPISDAIAIPLKGGVRVPFEEQYMYLYHINAHSAKMKYFIENSTINFYLRHRDLVDTKGDKVLFEPFNKHFYHPDYAPIYFPGSPHICYVDFSWHTRFLYRTFKWFWNGNNWFSGSFYSVYVIGRNAYCTFTDLDEVTTGLKLKVFTSWYPKANLGQLFVGREYYRDNLLQKPLMNFEIPNFHAWVYFKNYPTYLKMPFKQKYYVNDLTYYYNFIFDINSTIMRDFYLKKFNINLKYFDVFNTQPIGFDTKQNILFDTKLQNENFDFFAKNKLDVMDEKQIGFQDPATPTMEGLIDFHHELAFFMILISAFVLTFLLFIIFSFKNDNINNFLKFKKPTLISHNSILEIIWTIIPGMILFAIAVPSFALLYAMDEVINPGITLKAIGHQWYWSYEYGDPLPQFKKESTVNVDNLFNPKIVLNHIKDMKISLNLKEKLDIVEDAFTFKILREYGTEVAKTDVDQFEKIQKLKNLLYILDGEFTNKLRVKKAKALNIDFAPEYNKAEVIDMINDFLLSNNVQVILENYKNNLNIESEKVKITKAFSNTKKPLRELISDFNIEKGIHNLNIFGVIKKKININLRNEDSLYSNNIDLGIVDPLPSDETLIEFSNKEIQKSDVDFETLDRHFGIFKDITSYDMIKESFDNQYNHATTLSNIFSKMDFNIKSDRIKNFEKMVNMPLVSWETSLGESFYTFSGLGYIANRLSTQRYATNYNLSYNSIGIKTYRFKSVLSNYYNLLLSYVKINYPSFYIQYFDNSNTKYFLNNINIENTIDVKGFDNNYNANLDSNVFDDVDYNFDFDDDLANDFDTLTNSYLKYINNFGLYSIYNKYTNKKLINLEQNNEKFEFITSLNLFKLENLVENELYLNLYKKNKKITDTMDYGIIPNNTLYTVYNLLYNSFNDPKFSSKTEQFADILVKNAGKILLFEFSNILKNDLNLNVNNKSIDKITHLAISHFLDNLDIKSYLIKLDKDVKKNKEILLNFKNEIISSINYAKNNYTNTNLLIELDLSTFDVNYIKNIINEKINAKSDNTAFCNFLLTKVLNKNLINSKNLNFYKNEYVSNLNLEIDYLNNILEVHGYSTIDNQNGTLELNSFDFSDKIKDNNSKNVLLSITHLFNNHITDPLNKFLSIFKINKIELSPEDTESFEARLELLELLQSWVDDELSDDGFFYALKLAENKYKNLDSTVLSKFKSIILEFETAIQMHNLKSMESKFFVSKLNSLIPSDIKVAQNVMEHISKSDIIRINEKLAEAINLVKCNRIDLATALKQLTTPLASVSNYVFSLYIKKFIEEDIAELNGLFRQHRSYRNLDVNLNSLKIIKFLNELEGMSFIDYDNAPLMEDYIEILNPEFNRSELDKNLPNVTPIIGNISGMGKGSLLKTLGDTDTILDSNLKNEAVNIQDNSLSNEGLTSEISDLKQNKIITVDQAISEVLLEINKKQVLTEHDMEDIRMAVMTPAGTKSERDEFRLIHKLTMAQLNDKNRIAMEKRAKESSYVDELEELRREARKIAGIEGLGQLRNINNDRPILLDNSDYSTDYPTLSEMEKLLKESTLSDISSNKGSTLSNIDISSNELTNMNSDNISVNESTLSNMGEMQGISNNIKTFDLSSLNEKPAFSFDDLSSDESTLSNMDEMQELSNNKAAQLLDDESYFSDESRYSTYSQAEEMHETLNEHYPIEENLDNTTEIDETLENIIANFSEEDHYMIEEQFKSIFENDFDTNLDLLTNKDTLNYETRYLFEKDLSRFEKRFYKYSLGKRLKTDEEFSLDSNISAESSLMVEDVINTKKRVPKAPFNSFGTVYTLNNSYFIDYLDSIFADVKSTNNFITDLKSIGNIDKLLGYNLYDTHLTNTNTIDNFSNVLDNVYDYFYITDELPVYEQLPWVKEKQLKESLLLPIIDKDLINNSISNIYEPVKKAKKTSSINLSDPIHLIGVPKATYENYINEDSNFDIDTLYIYEQILASKESLNYNNVMRNSIIENRNNLNRNYIKYYVFGMPTQMVSQNKSIFKSVFKKIIGYFYEMSPLVYPTANIYAKEKGIILQGTKKLFPIPRTLGKFAPSFRFLPYIGHNSIIGEVPMTSGFQGLLNSVVLADNLFKAKAEYFNFDELFSIASYYSPHYTKYPLILNNVFHRLFDFLRVHPNVKNVVSTPMTKSSLFGNYQFRSLSTDFKMKDQYLTSKISIGKKRFRRFLKFYRNDYMITRVNALVDCGFARVGTYKYVNDLRNSLFEYTGGVKGTEGFKNFLKTYSPDYSNVKFLRYLRNNYDKKYGFDYLLGTNKHNFLVNKSTNLGDLRKSKNILVEIDREDRDLDDDEFLYRIMQHSNRVRFAKHLKEAYNTKEYKDVSLGKLKFKSYLDSTNFTPTELFPSVNKYNAGRANFLTKNKYKHYLKFVSMFGGIKPHFNLDNMVNLFNELVEFVGPYRSTPKWSVKPYNFNNPSLFNNIYLYDLFSKSNNQINKSKFYTGYSTVKNNPTDNKIDYKNIFTNIKGQFSEVIKNISNIFSKENIELPIWNKINNQSNNISFNAYVGFGYHLYNPKKVGKGSVYISATDNITNIFDFFKGHDPISGLHYLTFVKPDMHKNLYKVNLMTSEDLNVTGIMFDKKSVSNVKSAYIDWYSDKLKTLKDENLKLKSINYVLNSHKESIYSMYNQFKKKDILMNEWDYKYSTYLQRTINSLDITISEIKKVLKPGLFHYILNNDSLVENKKEFNILEDKNLNSVINSIETVYGPLDGREKEISTSFLLSMNNIHQVSEDFFNENKGLFKDFEKIEDESLYNLFNVSKKDHQIYFKGVLPYNTLKELSKTFKFDMDKSMDKIQNYLDNLNTKKIFKDTNINLDHEFTYFKIPGFDLELTLPLTFIGNYNLELKWNTVFFDKNVLFSYPVFSLNKFENKDKCSFTVTVYEYPNYNKLGQMLNTIDSLNNFFKKYPKLSKDDKFRTYFNTGNVTEENINDFVAAKVQRFSTIYTGHYGISHINIKTRISKEYSIFTIPSNINLLNIDFNGIEKSIHFGLNTTVDNLLKTKKPSVLENISNLILGGLKFRIAGQSVMFAGDTVQLPSFSKLVTLPELFFNIEYRNKMIDFLINDLLLNNQQFKKYENRQRFDKNRVLKIRFKKPHRIQKNIKRAIKLSRFVRKAVNKGMAIELNSELLNIQKNMRIHLNSLDDILFCSFGLRGVCNKMLYSLKFYNSYSMIFGPEQAYLKYNISQKELFALFNTVKFDILRSQMETISRLQTLALDAYKYFDITEKTPLLHSNYIADGDLLTSDILSSDLTKTDSWEDFSNEDKHLFKKYMNIVDMIKTQKASNKVLQRIFIRRNTFYRYDEYNKHFIKKYKNRKPRRRLLVTMLKRKHLVNPWIDSRDFGHYIYKNVKRGIYQLRFNGKDYRKYTALEFSNSIKRKKEKFGNILTALNKYRIARVSMYSYDIYKKYDKYTQLSLDAQKYNPTTDVILNDLEWNLIDFEAKNWTLNNYFELFNDTTTLDTINKSLSTNQNIADKKMPIKYFNKNYIQMANAIETNVDKPSKDDILDQTGLFYSTDNINFENYKKKYTTEFNNRVHLYADRFYNIRTGNALIRFDSYMLPEDELAPGMFRCLEVDQRAVLPEKIHVRVLVTSDDVLHSWAIPSLGVKMDACPGRLNQTEIFAKRTGVFYGQCSEICGVNHGFMPIVLEIVHPNSYANWIYKKFLGKE